MGSTSGEQVSFDELGVPLAKLAKFIESPTWETLFYGQSVEEVLEGACHGDHEFATGLLYMCGAREDVPRCVSHVRSLIAGDGGLTSEEYSRSVEAVIAYGRQCEADNHEASAVDCLDANRMGDFWRTDDDFWGDRFGQWG